MSSFGTSVIISSIVYAIIFFSIFHEIGFAIFMGGIMGFVSTAFFQILGLNNDEKKEVIYSGKTEDTVSDNKEKITSMFAYQLTSFGLSASEAMSNSRKMVEEALSELPNDINPYATDIGNKNIDNDNFMKPRLAAKLTIKDIQTYYNKPPLVIACEFKIRQMSNFAFLHMKESQGEDIEEAANYYKKVTPRYGQTHLWDSNDKYNEGLSIDDADLYPEFGNRINNWLDKTPREEIDALINKYGTFNAAARFLIKNDSI
jgi:hypothetical protein